MREGAGEELRAHLDEAADDLRQHVEGKAEDVEERQGHEGLLCVQDVVLIDRHVHRERRQGNL